MITIKSTAFAIIWTIILVAFGVYIAHDINDFTSIYEKNMVKIEKSIDENNWGEAEEVANELADKWDNKKSKWYKSMDHASFNLIGTHFNVLKRCIQLKDKVNSYEQIENIKSHISNIKGNVNYGFDYIF